MRRCPILQLAGGGLALGRGDRISVLFGLLVFIGKTAHARLRAYARRRLPPSQGMMGLYINCLLWVGMCYALGCWRCAISTVTRPSYDLGAEAGRNLGMNRLSSLYQHLYSSLLFSIQQKALPLIVQVAHLVAWHKRPQQRPILAFFDHHQTLFVFIIPK